MEYQFVPKNARLGAVLRPETTSTNTPKTTGRGACFRTDPTAPVPQNAPTFFRRFERAGRGKLRGSFSAVSRSRGDLLRNIACGIEGGVGQRI
jgi:hypothetical protein